MADPSPFLTVDWFAAVTGALGAYLLCRGQPTKTRRTAAAVLHMASAVLWLVWALRLDLWSMVAMQAAVLWLTASLWHAVLLAAIHRRRSRSNRPPPPPGPSP